MKVGTCLRLEEAETLQTRIITNYLVAAGDAAGFTDTGELDVAGAGVEAACDAAGLAAGSGLVEPAGRSPRLLGLVSIWVARLLMIFASFFAVSNNAAFRICLR